MGKIINKAGTTRIWNYLADMAKGFADLCYPPRCLMCRTDVQDEPYTYVCRECLEQIEFMRSPRCLRCGVQLEITAGGEDHYCGQCLKRQPVFDSARSVVRYRQPVAGLLHRLKYKGDTSVKGAIREIITHEAAFELKSMACDCIAPIPLYPDRLKKRGLNQSVILAGVAFREYKNKIVPDLLKRVKNTIPQTNLDGYQRRRNLKGAFEINGAISVEAKNIWLVDDVFTTGTTVNECARVLKKCGAARVDVWTFARV